MTADQERAAIVRGGVPGDFHEDANALARKAWRALNRGTGMHLTADEVRALHQMEGDGDWWLSFSPADHHKDQGHG